MRVQVQVVCAPHPRREVEAALLAAGKELALTADSVSVMLDAPESSSMPRTASLEFEMRRAAQYKVVGSISETARDWAWEFYEVMTVRFP